MGQPEQITGYLLLLLGVLGVLSGGAMQLWPAAVRRGLAAFPRSRGPGWILSAVGVFWVAWVIQHAALGRFEMLKPLVPVGGILLFVAMVIFLDELLAPRALGGVLLLVANPMLMGVRWADTAWRFVPVVVAYVWVVAGCALMLHPWLFRSMVARFLPSDSAVRFLGRAKLAAGALLVVAGGLVLR